ncbi:tetratricopeptide repeat protein [Enterovirga aerilata]|uniref:Tetratricopeptide repeat protein n=1 Tax=Enterovirga aerilata TaxID=2730920 RepID=A0A849I7P1_9HYPH|nr:tetratricopeptide repeat protein [Enterovirga sp. DB1703]NNM73398.1 tetratricopeptide repeat protein [Enterovirga sp. DB1703]
MPHTVTPAEPGSGDQVVTLQEALEIAVSAHRSGDLQAAEEVYGRIVAAAPDWAPALHFYGLLHHHRGKSEEAVRMIRRAISLGGDPGMHNNLGNIFSELGRPAEAAEAYEAAIRLYPEHSDALSNRGVALRALGRLEEAEASYRRAIEVDPRHREAYDNLGGLLSGLGRVQEAIACHAHAMELQPRNADTRRLLASAYTATGEYDKALEILRAWLDQEPNSPTARHLYAAISGRDVPERAGDAFVETTFDRFAATFDAKLAKLDYRAPELVGAAVAGAAGKPGGDLAVLDAGCGTGLCGPLLRPYASRLVGVDLSSKMLQGAASRGGYDELVHGELTGFLQSRPACFDVIVSADTLCYFGPLEAVLAAAAAALRPGGLIAFTVEEEEGPEEVRLNPHGRYSHRAGYVERVLAGAGLAGITIARDILRKERGLPVGGLVVTARMPA